MQCYQVISNNALLKCKVVLHLEFVFRSIFYEGSKKNIEIIEMTSHKMISDKIEAF